jgi:hypothetical protein
MAGKYFDSQWRPGQRTRRGIQRQKPWDR